MFKKIATLLAITVASIAHAWEPTKPVNMIIAYGPGSGNEVLFRKIETIIAKTEKVNFVIDFKPGAYELIGMNHFAGSNGDGHTLYAPGVGVYYGTPVWFKKNLVQDVTEWIPVISLGESPIALFASSTSKVNTPAEFKEQMRANKTDVGVGAPVMVITYEYMAKQSRATNSQRVQFNSPAAVAQAVASNQVEFGIAPLSVGIELAKAGKLKVVGITGNQKFGDYASLGSSFDGLDMVAHVGVMLPKGTPQPVVDYYRKIFTAAVATDEYKEFLKGINWYDSLRTSKNYEAFVANQRKKWIPVAETIQFN